MKISQISLENHIEKLNNSLKDCSFYSPVLLNNKTLLFPIKEKRNHYLVISLNRNDPLFYEIKDETFYASFETPTFLSIKHYLGETRFEKITLDGKVHIHLTRNASDNFEPLEITLELIKHYTDIRVNLSTMFGYKFPNSESLIAENGLKITEEYIQKHYQNELILRKKEKYHNFITYINGKIKSVNKKIEAINKDVEDAKENLKYKDIADNIFTLSLDNKGHYKEIDVYGEIVTLDERLTLMDNIQILYKKARKAKITIEKSEENLANANKELEIYGDLKRRFDEAIIEKDADKIVSESGMIKKKKETVETIFNRPYKINLNGTIFYFGRNASQNDYLSFVMKYSRDYTWMHIKDKSGAHIIICNNKPTENELIFAAEIALIASKVTTGEVTYTRKKNVRRGHKLGEAIIKNYSTLKLNNIREESRKLFEKAEKI